jgi:hypothetical protein
LLFTNLCLAAIAAGLFLIAYEFRQLRAGRVAKAAADDWWRALGRHVAREEAKLARPRRNY